MKVTCLARCVTSSLRSYAVPILGVCLLCDLQENYVEYSRTGHVIKGMSIAPLVPLPVMKTCSGCLIDMDVEILKESE